MVIYDECRGKDQDYQSNFCVPTKPALMALYKLKKIFPKLDIDELVFTGKDNINVIDLNDLPTNQFLDKVD
jgi:hypothetical protein